MKQATKIEKSLFELCEEYRTAIYDSDTSFHNLSRNLSNHNRLSWKKILLGTKLTANEEREKLAHLLSDEQFFEIKNEVEQLVYLAKAGRVISRPIPEMLRLPTPSKENKEKLDQVKKIRGALASYLVAQLTPLASTIPEKQLSLHSLKWFNDNNKYLWPVNVSCPTCGAIRNGHAGLDDGSGHWSNDFYKSLDPCKKCGHNDLFNCNCEYCDSQLQTFTKTINTTAKTALDILNNPQLIIDKIKKSFDNDTPKQTPEIEMMRLWKLHQNNLSKSLRAIIDLQPQNIEDLISCINSYSNINGQNKNSLMEQAKNIGLVYSVEETIPTDPIQKSLCITLETKQGNTELHKEEVLEVLSSIGSASHNDLTHTMKWSSDLCGSHPTHAWPQDSAVFFDVTHALRTLRFTSYITRDSLLNPYFLTQSQTSEVHPQPAVNSPCLFRSATEQRAFDRLCQQNPDYVVVPNRKLHQLTDLNIFKSEFSQKDFKYLLWCEIDFCIYTGNGILLWVEEMQRGPHHDTPKYIYRDALKRKVLNLAKIRLEETF